MNHPYPMRRPLKMACRTNVYRPRVESLEERLPPGDLLLAKLWGPSWFGANAAETSFASSSVPSAATPVRRSVPESHSPPVTLLQHQPPEQTLNNDTQSLIAPPAITPIGMDDGLDPSAALDALTNPGGSHGLAPARHFVSPQVAMTHAVEDGAAAAPVASPSTPGTFLGANPPAVTEADIRHPANDLNFIVASTPIVPLGNGLDGQGDDGSDGPPPNGSVHALFQLDATTAGPFPADRFTVADRTQNTNRRVNLPYPDCTVYVSDCQDIAVLNELDGFNLQPRLSVPFDGAIDVNSVNSQSMFLVSLGDTLNRHDHGGQVVGINQVVWDTFSTTLHVESDQLLDQHTRYALIVTNSIHDPQGQPVQASGEFLHFRHDLSHSHDPVLRFYGQELEEAVRAARHVGVRERDIVDAGVFTTESATAVLEKIRDQIHAARPQPADFNLGPHGERTVFNRADVTGIHWERQTGDDPPSFSPIDVDLSLLNIAPGAVAQIAFGKYVSPDYEVHPGEYIPPVGTRTGTPAVQGHNEIFFNLFLPSGRKPEAGWPVAIVGHTYSTNKNNGIPLFVAATLAEQGIATIGINIVGHGFGPDSTLTVHQADGGSVTFPEGGRGIDQTVSHTITNVGGFFTAPPRALITVADGNRQTVADLMQLVREIEAGMDVDGNGTPDLDPSRIYFAGASQGGEYGTMFMAVEPDVRAGTLTVPGDLWVDLRLGTIVRNTTRDALAERVPSLINAPGVTTIDGLPVNGNGPYFNENLPLRDGIPFTVHLEDGTDQVIQSPVSNAVPGAIAIQEVLDHQVWGMMSGDTLAYAPHVRKAPLPGVPAKSVIYQFDAGDEIAPNPATTALLRAGDLADQATYYRNDLAHAKDPQVPTVGHQFLWSYLTNPDPLVAAIARGAQEQIATFLASDGTTIIHPEPARFFETPIQGPLPEDLNYIP